MTRLPTAADVDAARAFLKEHLAPTPLIGSEALSKRLGCDYRVKCESFQPVGAFKVRGAVNLVGRLSESELASGLISASTGNHGQAMAWAGGRFGASVVIYAPAEGANPAKLEAMVAGTRIVREELSGQPCAGQPRVSRIRQLASPRMRRAAYSCPV